MYSVHNTISYNFKRTENNPKLVNILTLDDHQCNWRWINGYHDNVPFCYTGKPTCSLMGGISRLKPAFQHLLSVKRVAGCKAEGWAALFDYRGASVWYVLQKVEYNTRVLPTSKNAPIIRMSL